jgi:hypothetical protein
MPLSAFELSIQLLEASYPLLLKRIRDASDMVIGLLRRRHEHRPVADIHQDGRWRRGAQTSTCG